MNIQHRSHQSRRNSIVVTTVDTSQSSENLCGYNQRSGPSASSINHLHREVNLKDGLRDGSAIVCVVRVLSGSAKVD